MQLHVSSSFLGFRHESIVIVRGFYTECNARFR
jgi:ribosomal protein S13